MTTTPNMCCSKRAFLTDVRRPRRWVAAAYSLVQWRKLTGYERRVCRTADRVVAVSDVDAEALRQLAPGLEVTVIPNGVDLEFNRPGAVAPGRRHGRQRTGLHRQDGLPPERGCRDLVRHCRAAGHPGADPGCPFLHRGATAARTRAGAGRASCRHGDRSRARRAALHRRRGRLCRAAAHRRRHAAEGARSDGDGPGARLHAPGLRRLRLRAGPPGVFRRRPRRIRRGGRRAAARSRRAADLGRHARAYVEAHFGWDAIVPRLEALYA